MPNIRPATDTESDWLQQSFAQIGWTKPDGYFAGCLERQHSGQIVLLIAEQEGTYLGHCNVAWQPDHPFFKENQIPETQDLNVLPDYRRQGVASALMDEAERLIKQRANQAGIGVGLYADYGPAQRMYVARGYVPCGTGLVYDNAYVQKGQSYSVDDSLVMALVKSL